MDPSDSHQPLNVTNSTYFPEGVTDLNLSPLPSLTLNELNRVDEAQVDEPVVQPHVEPVVPPQVETRVEPHVASASALVPAQPSSIRRPYTDMIYEAVVALNEPNGSTKGAISSYIRRSNRNVPEGHEALMTHHLEVMKRCGILTMVRKSYKLADSPPPENVAAAAVDPGLVASGSNTGQLDMLADAVDTGLVVASGSEIPPTYTGPLDMVPFTASDSASQPLKRGRGRPPKPRTVAPQQQQPPTAAQPISQAVQPSINVEPSSAVQPSQEQPELPVADPTPPVVNEAAKRGPGRPRRDGSGPSDPTPGLAVMMKRRGWPMSSRASGRESEPVSDPAPDSVIPDVAIGAAGRPERPRRGGSSGGGVATLAPAGEEAMAVAAVMKRGPGRPPKRGRGRAARRPIQETPRPVTRATGTIQEPAYGELKSKILVANERVKEILHVVDTGIATGDNRAVAEVSQALRALIKVLTLEPHAKEEVQPEEAEPQNKAETQGMELGQGSGGGEQAQMPLPHTLTFIGPEHQLHELEPLPDLEPLLEPLPLTQPQIQLNTEAEPAMDEDDMF